MFARRLLLGALTASLLGPAGLRAQPVSRATALGSRPAEPRSFAPGLVDAPRAEATGEIAADRAVTWIATTPKGRKDEAPWWAPVASAVVPGSGQLVMGQQRGVAYMVAELYLVVQAMTARRDWEARRDEYRSIATDVARRQFGGSFPLGPWDYYEAMQGLPTGALPFGSMESGVFDLVPGGGIDPETDEGTYNGATWRVARETYWADPNSTPATSSPEYQSALAVYERTAIRDEYRWSWRDAGNLLDVYRQTIASANRSYQRSVSMAGLVGMNHLTSMIDAYVTTRIRRFGGVKAAGLSLQGIESGVQAVGDPALKRYQFSSTLRFVPTGR